MRLLAVGSAVLLLLVNSSVGNEIVLKNESESCETHFTIADNVDKEIANARAQELSRDHKCIDPKKFDADFDLKKMDKAQRFVQITDELRGDMELRVIGSNYELTCLNALGGIIGKYVFNKDSTPQDKNPERYQKSSGGIINHLIRKKVEDNLRLYDSGGNFTLETDSKKVGIYRKFCNILTLQDLAFASKKAELVAATEQKIGIEKYNARLKSERIELEKKRKEYQECIADPNNRMAGVASRAVDERGEIDSDLVSAYGLLHEGLVINSTTIAQVENLFGDKRDDAKTIAQWGATLVEINELREEFGDMESEGQVAPKESKFSFGWRLMKPNRCIDTPEGDFESFSQMGVEFIEVDDKGNRYDITNEFETPYSSSVVYKATNSLNQQATVKYTLNCKQTENGNIDDVAFNDYVTRIVVNKYNENIATEVYSLSAAAIIDGGSGGDKRLLTNNKCLNQPNSSVRALIEKYTGSVPLTKWLFSKPRGVEYGFDGSDIAHALRFSISICKSTIQLLRELHDIGFIHGNVRKESVICGDDNCNERNRLTNFEYSRYFPSEMALDSKTTNDQSWAHPIRERRTSFQLDDFRVGRRCDLEQAIEMIADILGHWTQRPTDFFGSKLATLVSNDKLLEFKKSRYFSNPLFGQENNNQALCKILLSDNKDFRKQCQKAMKFLDDAMDVVRATTHSDAKPDYDEIISKLNDAGNVIKAYVDPIMKEIYKREPQTGIVVPSAVREQRKERRSGGNDV